MPIVDSYEYEAYGLVISSSIPLPGLSEQVSTAEETSDLTVVRGSLPEDSTALEGEAIVYDEPGEPFSAYRSEDTIHWFDGDIGALRVHGGREITVDPDETADPDAVRRLILGPGLASTLIQRGRLVFHASAVLVDGTAIAFAGRSGRGKSTTAAACYASGYNVIADDLTAVAVHEDGPPAVESGYPQLRVDDDVARRLGIDTRTLGTTAGKLSIDVADGFHRSRRQLDTIYLLDQGEVLTSEVLSPRTAVFELLQRSYSLYGNSDTGALEIQLENAASVANRCEVRRLIRPQSLTRLDDLVALVQAETQ